MFTFAFDIAKSLIYTNKLALYKRVLKNGLVAQLVEQRTENPRVGSSILSQATIFIEQKRIVRCAFVRLVQHFF